MEVRQAVELLPTWADIDVEDALELLGPGFVHADVRSYAVSQLKKADDNVRIGKQAANNFHWIGPFFFELI